MRKKTLTEIGFCEAHMVYLGERTPLGGRIADTVLYLLFDLLHFIVFLITYYFFLNWENQKKNPKVIELVSCAFLKHPSVLEKEILLVLSRELLD